MHYDCLRLFSRRTRSDTLKANGVWDRLGVLYILCSDWRKNRKHSYITRGNHCTQIDTCIYTNTHAHFAIYYILSVMLYCYLESLSYWFLFLTRGHTLRLTLDNGWKSSTLHKPVFVFLENYSLQKSICMYSKQLYVVKDYDLQE